MPQLKKNVHSVKDLLLLYLPIKKQPVELITTFVQRTRSYTKDFIHNNHY